MTALGELQVGGLRKISFSNMSKTLIIDTAVYNRICVKTDPILLPNSFWMKLTQQNRSNLLTCFLFLLTILNWATVSDPF
jgi:hypothetical protein